MRLEQEHPDFQRLMLQAAREANIDLSRASVSQYKMLALRIRSAREKIRDGSTAVVSRALTSVRLRVVPDKVFERNLSVCRTNTCGKYRTNEQGLEACDACTCSGKWLESKLRDAVQKCPLGLWDNTEVTNSETFVVNLSPEKSADV